MAEVLSVQRVKRIGAKLDARNKLGWTALMIAEGGQFGATVKEFPEAAGLIRKLMTSVAWMLSNTVRPARDAWPPGGTRDLGLGIWD